MVSILRRFQQPLMIGITIVIIITFSYYGSKQDFSDRGAGKIATIYGRAVSFTQTQRIGRRFGLCESIGLYELLGSLASHRGDQENFIWNSLVLKHEAEKLGIDPTEDDVIAAIQAMPSFQTNGVYDSAKYSMLTQIALAPRGFTTDDLADVIGDDLRLKRIKAILGSTVAPSESELRTLYTQQTQKTEASVVRLKLDDFLATTQVSDEDLKKAYEEQKARLKTDEFRKVKYVAFTLPKADKPMEGPERSDALAALQKKAEEFSVAMTEKDAKFEEVAAKAGAKVEETADFSRATPPAEFGGSREAVMNAFKLTPAQPNGDVINTMNGYYVIQLAGITPPRPLTFDEAKVRLTDELKRDRATESLSLKAAEIRNKIDAEIKAGKPFADAVLAAGAKAEKFPAFSNREPQQVPENSAEITGVAGELNVGQLSTATPTTDGSAIIVYIDNRPPIDEEKFKTEKSQFVERLAGDQKAVLFAEWLKLRRAAANLQLSSKG